jgi:hypothetical protein
MHIANALSVTTQGFTSNSTFKNVEDSSQRAAVCSNFLRHEREFYGLAAPKISDYGEGEIILE